MYSANIFDDFDELLGCAKRSNVRAMLKLQGNRSWCTDLCAALVSRCDSQQLYVTDDDIGAQRVGAKAVAGLLGNEYDVLVYDGFYGLNPSALGAISGMVRGGGVFIVLIPPKHEWPLHDPDYSRLQVHGNETASGYFTQRLLNRLDDHNVVWSVCQNAAPTKIPQLSGPAYEYQQRPFDFNSEQINAIEAGVRVVTGHGRRPMVLSADRGRGKSTVLAEVAARLLAERDIRIIVTAPTKKCMTIFWSHLCRALEIEECQDELNYGGSVVTYVPVDELLSNCPAAGLLIIDEAAGVPIPTLLTLTQNYSRLILATTVHGYEGSGRGFSLRFLPALMLRYAQTRVMELHDPVRWAVADTVEPWFYKTLLLDVDCPSAELASEKIDLRTSWLSRDELATNEELLRQVFGLLLQAHYRTTPDDLRVLLDGPNIRLLAARHESVVVGVVMVACEGQIDASTHDGILRGSRRVSGHVIPQMLAANTGANFLLDARSWRIVRVAVNPRLQRREIGSTMLGYLELKARSEGVDYLGASFGGGQDVMPFWLATHFTPVYIGWRQDSISGGNACLVLRAVNAQGDAELLAYQKNYAAQLPHLFADSLSDVDWRMVAPIARYYSSRVCAQMCYPADGGLKGFAYGHSQYEPLAGALVYPAWWLLGQNLEPDEQQLLVEKVLCKQNWPTVVGRRGSAGKSVAVADLRQLVGRFIESSEHNA